MFAITTDIPTSQVKKAINYAESSDDEDQDVFATLKAKRARANNRVRPSVVDDDEDDFDGDNGDPEEEDGMPKNLSSLTCRLG